MTNTQSRALRVLTVALSAALLAAPAMADKPAHAGGGKPEHAQSVQSERGPGVKAEARDNGRSNDDGRYERRDRRDVGDRRDMGDRRDVRDRDGERYRDDRRDRNQTRDYRDGRRDGPRVGIHFGDRHREIVREYYGERYRSGHCPPGLAKKRNGCMPPGQAKRWRIGQPLPRNVVYYDAPRDIVLRFGMPPEGHRYVRVAADILLIAVGTGMVVDAIEDLNRL